ncbi:MAG: tRNA (N6-threonylcarbamoyladenosine(37)-N6)-methyltransferase TrmO [Candidatus Bipolaricaulaceae bacterium]
MAAMELVPIGYVESPARLPAAPEEVAGHPARVHIRAEFRSALEGVEPGNQILILFWMDRADRKRRRVHPRGDPHRPQRGVFATRSPHRPNPIGATLVRVREVDPERGVLRVEGLDALDGSPVLDIKAAPSSQG